LNILFISQIYVSGKPVCDLHENDGASVTQFKYNYHIEKDPRVEIDCSNKDRYKSYI